MSSIPRKRSATSFSRPRPFSKKAASAISWRLPILWYIARTQFRTIPPTVGYSLAERGRTLIPALESVNKWAEDPMK